MAFFKFRLPANAPAVSDAHSAAPGESVEAIRRRARHRLIGAVVLVFVAVVAFPLIFDAQPRPVAVDTPIVIPDRQSTPALAVGQAVPAAQAPAKPLLSAVPAASPASADAAAAASGGAPAVSHASAPGASSVPAPASLEPGKEEVVAPSAASKAAAATPASAAPAKAEVRSESKTDAKAEHKNGHSGDGKADSKNASKPGDDGLKAKALLEGRDSAAEKLVIQVGAFSDEAKVREVRRKLEQAGLKTYTQTIEGKDGKRSTRVRVGPFDSRAEADKAAARVRKLDLPANLIAL